VNEPVRFLPRQVFVWFPQVLPALYYFLAPQPYVPLLLFPYLLADAQDLNSFLTTLQPSFVLHRIGLFFQLLVLPVSGVYLRASVALQMHAALLPNVLLLLPSLQAQVKQPQQAWHLQILELKLLRLQATYIYQLPLQPVSGGFLLAVSQPLFSIIHPLLASLLQSKPLAQDDSLLQLSSSRLIQLLCLPQQVIASFLSLLL